MEGALGQGSRSSLTGWAVEAVLVPRKRLEIDFRVLAGRDRERQRHPLPTLFAAENVATVGASSGSDARLCSEMSKSCEQRSQSLASAVERLPTWGRAAARQHGVVAARALRCTLKREPQRRAASVSGTAKAARPGVERSTGARVVMSVAEVGEKHLLVALDGELKGKTDRAVGSAARRLIP
jgi:hypothetical protein